MKSANLFFVFVLYIQYIYTVQREKVAIGDGREAP